MNAKNVHKTMTTCKSFCLIIAVCFLFAAPPISAQDAGGQESYGGQQEYQYQQPQKTDISDNDLQKFALALNDVADIRSEYSEVISDVKDAEKAQELQSKYTQQMIESIEDRGLEVQQYNEISMAMQQDPEIQEKVQELAQ